MKSQQNHKIWRHFPQRSLCLGSTNKVVRSRCPSTAPDYTFKKVIELGRVAEQLQDVKHQQLLLSWARLIHIFNNSVPLTYTPSKTGKKGKAGQEKNFYKILSGHLHLLIPTLLQYSSLPFCDSYIASHLLWQYFYEQGKCCFSFHANGELIVSESKWLEPLSPEFLLCSWMKSSVTFFTCQQVENNNSLNSDSQPELFTLHKNAQQAQPNKPLLTWRASCCFSFLNSFSALRNSIKPILLKQVRTK